MITVISPERQACETTGARLFAQCLKVGGRWDAILVPIPGLSCPRFSVRCRGPKVSETRSLPGERGTRVHSTIGTFWGPCLLWLELKGGKGLPGREVMFPVDFEEWPRVCKDEQGFPNRMSSPCRDVASWHV